MKPGWWYFALKIMPIMRSTRNQWAVCFSQWLPTAGTLSDVASCRHVLRPFCLLLLYSFQNCPSLSSVRLRCFRSVVYLVGAQNLDPPRDRHPMWTPNLRSCPTSHRQTAQRATADSRTHTCRCTSTCAWHSWLKDGKREERTWIFDLCWRCPSFWGSRCLLVGPNCKGDE